MSARSASNTMRPIGLSASLTPPVPGDLRSGMVMMMAPTPSTFAATREGHVSYPYDLNGRRTSMTNLAGRVNYTYFADDRLNTATSSNPALSAALTYDGNGRRQTLTITSGANAVTTSYDNYDAASRLTDVSYK